jgi:hypothetical protein
MPACDSGELRNKTDWLRLIETCKQVEGRTRLRLAKRFIVRYSNHTEIIPPGTEVIFFCLYKGPRGTAQKFRTEGVFYLPDGRTLSILGYYDRKVPKGREREYRRKTVEVKNPTTRTAFDAAPRRTLALAGV